MSSRGLTGFFRLRAEASEFELVVLDGADEGSRFALDAPELLLGRGDPTRRRENEILLTDPYVSSRQAMLRTSGGRVEIEHIPSATNATIVNGRPVSKRPLRPGDRIEVGRSKLELRAVEVRAEASPPAPEPAAPDARAVTADSPAPRPAAPVAPVAPVAHLEVTSGIADWVGRSFEVRPDRTTIGRSENCDILVPTRSVSRRHAALAWENGRLYLVHQSLVNPTLLNGVPVEESHVLANGDRISLADAVEFLVVLGTAAPAVAPVAPRAPAARPEPRPAPTVAPAEPAPREEPRPAPPAAPREPAAREEPRPARPVAPEPAARVEPRPARPVAPAAPSAKPEPRPAPPAARQPVAEAPVLAPRRAPAYVPTPPPAPYEGELSVVIVGSGPAGLAAAAQAARSGVPHTLLERGEFANTVHRYHKGKWVMDEPRRLSVQPELPVGFAAGTREDVLGEWQASMQRNGVNVKRGPAYELSKVEGKKGSFTLTTRDGSSFPATHIVLAIGVQGNLRSFGVPGDKQDWITYQLDDPAAYAGKTVVVVGVGDAGIENALALADQGCQVSLVNRHAEFDRAKARNRGLIEQAISQGRVVHHTNSKVEAFEDHLVVLRTDSGQVRIPADLVIGRLGATPARALPEGIGIQFPSNDPGAAPRLTAQYETNVPGVYVIGSLAGYPLIKSCMNQGYEVIEYIQGRAVVPADQPVLEQTLSVLGVPVEEALHRIQTEISIYSSLTTIQLREFLWDSEVLRLPVGHVVFRRNDFSDTFYAILEGAVRVTRPVSPLDTDVDLNPEQRREGQVILREGAFFGEGGLISGRRRSATVEVAEEAILIAAPRSSMIRLLRSVEEVQRIIDEAFVAARLRDLVPDLDPAKRAALAARAKILEFKPGEALFEEGDPPDGLHIIRRGTVTVSHRRDGLDSVIQYCQAGSILGEVALLAPGRVRSMTCRASVSTETVRFPYDDIVAFMRENEELVRIFQRNEREYAMADAARGAERRSDTLSFVLKEGGHEATDLLLIDEALCIRCDNCETACAGTHGGVSRLDREAGATYVSPRGSQIHMPTACQHCENPKCMDDCPPDALRRDPDGEVFIMDNCIGCGNCETNCPYGVIQMAAVDDDPGPGLLSRLLFGRVARKKTGPRDPSVKQLAVKCDLCRNLPPMRDGSARAACVASCPTGAIVRVNPRDYADELIERV